MQRGKKRIKVRALVQIGSKKADRSHKRTLRENPASNKLDILTMIVDGNNNAFFIQHIWKLILNFLSAEILKDVLHYKNNLDKKV